MRQAFQQTIWLFILLCGLASIGSYYVRTPKAIQLDNQVLRTQTDIVVTDLSVKEFNEQGQLIHSLSAPKLHHIPLDDKYVLEKPYIRIQQETQPQWTIYSRKAIAMHGNREITFQEHVRIQQAAQANSPAKLVKTEELTYFPATKMATTAKDILFKQAHNQVQARGMQADLSKNRVKLLSDAQGIYETG